MTDQAIADQICNGVRMALDRLEAANPQTRDETGQAVVREFLSGANQLAEFLVRNDGLVTAQQMTRGLKVAGLRLGFELGPPKGRGE